MASKKEAQVPTRRTSHMSVEGSLSPTMTGSEESISIAPSRRSRDDHEHKLAPFLTHTSSTGAVGGIVPGQLCRTLSRRSTASNASQSPAFEIDFAPDDSRNPRNWPLWYRGIIIAIMSYSTTCVVLYSTSYTSAIPGMEATWGISENTGILGVTTYLFGMATGAVILAPLSEMFGRRPIYLITLALFIVFVMPCAVAQNMATILALRFFGAFCAAALISNAPGSINDIVDDDRRALAFSVWSLGPMQGPVIGPVVGGFVYQYLGWRWTNWVVVIAAGVALGLVTFTPETYAPALLRKMSRKRREETDDPRWWSRYDDKESFFAMLKVNLSRPFVMTVTEPILIFWDVYIALVYGCLYLCFVAYPIVFTDIRGWTPGFSGLAFTGIGLGSTIVICIEPLIRRMINAQRIDPETGKVFPEAMVSVVSIAAVLIPVGQIWFAWTSFPTTIHWIWPILAGIPFGMGNCGVFIYATNYLVHSYGIYAASALAGNAVLRSIMGATLPLAGPSLFASLGPNWASTLLGLLEAAFIPIPFIFYRYGSKIRQKSALIRSMQEEEARLTAKQQKAEAKMLKRAEAEAEAGFAMGVTCPAVNEAMAGRKSVDRTVVSEKTP